MKRRDWLAAVPALAAARALCGGEKAGPRIALCAFSCHHHWLAVVKGEPGVRFHDTLEFLRYGRELGFEGVQCGFRPAEVGQVREIRGMVEEGAVFEAELRLPQVESDLASFEQAVTMACEAGARVARAVCMGGRRYEVFRSRGEFEAFTSRSKRSLEIAEPILARHRLRLAVENHKDHTAAELAALMKAISSEWIGVLVDTGNNLALLERPDETIAALAPYAASVHLKDMAMFMIEAGFRLSEVPLGTGVLDLKAIVSRLAAANPNLVFNLEMATRDPLVVPCRHGDYFATFPDRGESHLYRMLDWLAAHPSRVEVPEVSGKPIATVLAEEEQNNRVCLDWMKGRIIPI